MIRFQHAGDGGRRARVLRRADQDAAQVSAALTVDDELEPELAAKRQPLSQLASAADAEGWTMRSYF